jgi:hypothetical protein
VTEIPGQFEYDNAIILPGGRLKERDCAVSASIIYQYQFMRSAGKAVEDSTDAREQLVDADFFVV